MIITYLLFGDLLFLFSLRRSECVKSRLPSCIPAVLTAETTAQREDVRTALRHPPPVAPCGGR